MVVEFIIYTTPGPSGFAPRDLDRAWSVGVPLAKDLAPFITQDSEYVSDYVRGLFAAYKQARDVIVTTMREASERSAARANRWRKPRQVEVGEFVVIRDPRTRAAGGADSVERTTFRAVRSGRGEG